MSSHSFSSPLAESTALHALSSLPFPQFCVLVRAWLWRCGYASVRACGTGRRRKAWGEGGFDLLATAPTDLAQNVTLVQLKQSALPVQRRYVDELRGAMNRTGASHGLIVSLSPFSPRAMEAAAQSVGLPMVLVDGALLLRELERCGLWPLNHLDEQADTDTASLDTAFPETGLSPKDVPLRSHLLSLYDVELKKKAPSKKIVPSEKNGQSEPAQVSPTLPEWEALEARAWQVWSRRRLRAWRRRAWRWSQRREDV